MHVAGMLQNKIGVGDFRRKCMCTFVASFRGVNIMGKRFGIQEMELTLVNLCMLKWGEVFTSYLQVFPTRTFLVGENAVFVLFSTILLATHPKDGENATSTWHHKLCKHPKCVCLQYLLSKEMDLGRGVWIIEHIDIGYHLGPNLVAHDAHLDVLTAASIEQRKLYECCKLCTQGLLVGMRTGMSAQTTTTSTPCLKTGPNHLQLWWNTKDQFLSGDVWCLVLRGRKSMCSCLLWVG